MATGEDVIRKPPSPAHVSRELAIEKESTTPPALPQVVNCNPQEMKIMGETFVVENLHQSKGENTVNGMHPTIDSSSTDHVSYYNLPTENQLTDNGENNVNNMHLTPAKRGRGRPPKPKTASSELPVFFGPRRQRGRPRKHRDPLSVSAPRRGRGRPRKYPLSASAIPPRVSSSGRDPDSPCKQSDHLSIGGATPKMGTESTETTTKMEMKTITTTSTSTKGSSAADGSESTTTSTTTESTTPPVVKTS